ncbi:hypothetical protein [Nocardiopsis trehalosi]|uniref:hypothetical protein n=1 Tax=Nocardiopsis trehalosi TaxID=109329 RepID=UPI00082DA0EF|nr:hypothetical protein [Nocardiopsis trehalosi]
MNRGNGPGPHRSPVILVVAPDERSAEVTIEGRTRVVTGATPKETRRAALDVAAGYAAHLGTSVLINSRDANGAWQLIISPTGVVRAAGGTEVELTAGRGAKAGRPRRGRRVLMAAAGGTLAVAAVAGGGVVAVRMLPDITATRVDSAEDPAVTLEGRSAPPGFTTQAAWRLPTLPGTRPGVAPDGGAAAYVDPEERLTVVGPDGAELWSAELPLPAGDIEGAPTFVSDGDAYGLAVTGSGRLWLWPPSGGAPDEFTLPEGSRVTFAGASALVLGDGRALVPDDGGLRPIAMPSGYGAMLADPGRVLTAVQDGPWRWVGLDGETTEVEPEPPDGAGDLAEVLTARSRYVIVRWVAEEGDQALLAVHDSGDGSVVARTLVDPASLADARWLEGGSVAAYGPVVVDLDNGRATALEGFVPTSAAGDRVYGEAAGVPVAVGADAEPTDLPADVVRPWGLLDGRAVVIADGDLYALTPQ